MMTVRRWAMWHSAKEIDTPGRPRHSPDDPLLGRNHANELAGHGAVSGAGLGLQETRCSGAARHTSEAPQDPHFLRVLSNYGAAVTPEFPGPLFAAETFAALQVRVTDGAVHVDHALFEALEQVQVERALVDDIAHLHGQPVPDERQEVGERVHQTVDRLSDPVADRQRLQERHDDIPTGLHAIDT